MKTKTPKFELFKDVRNRWRWRLVYFDDKGVKKIGAISGSSYALHRDAITAVQWVRDRTYNTPIHEVS